MGKKWYKHLMLSILAIMILYSAIGEVTNATTVDEPTAELYQLANTLEDQNVELDGWRLYTRSQLNSSENFNDTNLEVRKIIEKTPSFHWNTSSDTNVYTGKLEHTFMTETITVIITPHKHEYMTYLIYEVNGDASPMLSSEMINEEVKNRLSDLFRKDTKIFTGVTGIIHDKLNFGLSVKAEELLKKFSATKVEELNEETFISLSAYTELWDTYIITNQKKMNLQVALRNTGMGGETTITIGTPIITVEY